MARQPNLTSISVERHASRAAAARFVIACLAVAASSASVPATELIDVEAGRQIYLYGIGSANQPIRATVQGDIPIEGKAAACANCHQRSGLGTAEAARRTPAITGVALLTPREGAAARSRYSTELLARAITTGLTSDGAPLDRLMPRYALSDVDLRALLQYLTQLGTAETPGVSDAELQLATIIYDGAPRAQQRAVEEVLRRYVDQHNSGSRHEERRAAASRRHVFGERQARAWRRWKLAIWRLSGPPSSWEEQLTDYYTRSPPFAMLSGALGSTAPIVHDFCERQRLPCILPLTDLAPPGNRDFYNLYYSPGARLDAAVTAAELLALDRDTSSETMLIYDGSPESLAARATLQEALAAAARPPPREVQLRGSRLTSPAEWRQLIGDQPAATIIAWIPAPQFATFTAIAHDGGRLPNRIFTAGTFTDWAVLDPDPVLLEHVRHVYQFHLAEDSLAQFPRESAWLNQQKLQQLDAASAARVLFAGHTAGEALADMGGVYSREYLLETLEHMLDGTGMTTVYPVTSLGPGQRHLVKGAYVATLVRNGSHPVALGTSIWRIP